MTDTDTVTNVTKQVATDKQYLPTDRPTNIPLLRSGAPSAPSVETPAAQIVAEYVREATAAGNRRFLDVRSKAILGGQAKLLMHQDDWPLEAVIRAVRRFANSGRNPCWLREWVRVNAMDEREAEHAKRMSEERASAPRTMRALGQAMREAGL